MKNHLEALTNSQAIHHHCHHLTRIFSSSALENRTKMGKSQNPASDPKMTSLTTILMSTVPTLMATSGKNVHNLAMQATDSKMTANGLISM